MNVLFIPHSMPAHLIPLLSLAKRLNINHFKIAFLVPSRYHSDIEKNGFTHLGINRNIEDNLSPEIQAIVLFKPDVIVDDLNYFSYFTCHLFSIPRISVVRKGILPFESHNPNLNHSSEIFKYLESLDQIDLSDFELDRPKSVSDLFRGDINIIPSIPLIEVLPEELRNDSSYIYSGPLILSDENMLGSHFSIEVIKSVEKFLERNRTAKIVYVDIGIVQPEIIIEKLERCFATLFNQSNVCIITNYISYTCKNNEEESRLFASDFLPSNLICSKADLMIHKCGSGSYNHQINNEVPSIILGSNCYDRDEVAMRMEEIGAALYISPNLDDEEYHHLFAKYVSKMLNTPFNEKNERQNILASIKEEIQKTQNAFDFEGLLKSMLANK